MLKKNELDDAMIISEVSDELIEEIYKKLNIERRGLEDVENPLRGSERSITDASK